ncbi:hypothetical protein JCM10295v2_003496 [Rhodotorula toruloides]
MFDGCDVLANELYADWLLYTAEAKRVRGEIEEKWKGKKRLRQAAHETWLYEENKRLYDLGGRLKARLEGSGGELLDNPFPKVSSPLVTSRIMPPQATVPEVHPDLDCGIYLSDLPSLNGKSLFAFAFSAARALVAKMAPSTALLADEGEERDDFLRMTE